MQKVQSRKEINGLIILFAMVYMVSYITRTNYATIIAEMENATSFSRSLLSMSITGSFITYGAGQIISGALGDRFSPKKLLLYGLIVTTLCNLLIPVCINPYQMLAVWCVNGFAQSFMWPPTVKLMVVLFDRNEYKKACAKISYGSSLGTIVLYLVSPVIISYFSWRAVFFFAAICGIITIFVWQKICPDVDVSSTVLNKEAPKKEGSLKILYTPAAVAVMLAIILQGMLRDGVTTWMPTYISDVYSMSSVISILTGVILPIFSIISFALASSLYIHKFKNPILCAGVFFTTGVISAITINLFSGINAAVSMLSFALLTGSMHGANLMLICMLPPFFARRGNVSTITGILNSCTYIGSAISTYGIALLSEKSGWDYTVLMWIIISGTGAVLCFVSGIPLIKKLLRLSVKKN